MSHERGRRLDGWKEISVYTGVPPRTLQRWERERRFPVRRLPGSMLESGRAAKVYAFTVEVDAWMANGAHGYERGVSLVRRRLLWGLALAAAVVGLGWGGFHLYRTHLNPPQPITATLDRDGLLTARDATGSVLWHYHFEGAPFLLGIPWRWPLTYVGDWNNDGFREVFAALVRENDFGDYLACLDASGSLRWVFRPEGPVCWGGEEISGRFRIKAVRASGRLRDGRTIFAVAFNYFPLFPGTIVVLDGEGRLVGQYWNTGFVFDLDFIDVDADGQDEIVFGGINNRLNAPVVGLIDATVQNAISPVPAGYAPGLTAGQERVYRVIPRTPLADAWQADSRVFYVDVTENGVIWVETQVRGDPHIWQDPQERVYLLGPDLVPFKLELPHSYRVLHQRLYEEGKITRPVDDDLIRSLLRFEDPVVPGVSGLRPPSSGRRPSKSAEGIGLAG